MSFISVLDDIGNVIEKIFAVAVPVATDLEPIFDAFFPQWAGLYSEGLAIITDIETAFGAAQAKKAGKAKMAVAVSQFHPKVLARAAALKIAPPTYAQSQAYLQSIVDGMKTFESARK